MDDNDEALPHVSGKISVDQESRDEKKAVANQEPSQPDLDAGNIANDRSKQDNEESRIYAERAYNIVFIWIAFLFAIIFLQFFTKRFGFGLGKEEFIAVVGSLTASMFGFWYLVGRHLFPIGPKK